MAPPEWGCCSTDVPGAFGGNMDNKGLKAGTTFYLPVCNEGVHMLLAKHYL
ncbi:hypothetical protein JMJ56_21615 [Belnapia sp. T18]|uniref:Uncharacterized protein n=1 Tax=Belnapia arida TaxID=2804533 RepID=A0ABS1U8Y4_9PROT|nr:hypothetical protein [Belnapia arida]MBL6080620.1 hypothetical protein [Belnapia arida]